ncbi:MAG: outer membrane beta-barrel protein [Bacteroidales bacterium]|nr:outer membrane beta-barrel protein [Bacteroidales bacterium]
MYKRLFLLVMVVFLGVQSLSAQNDVTPYTTDKNAEAKPVIFRDRLIMDIFHSFWMGMPSQVNYKKFDPGFNISAMWDFQIKKKPLSFGLGVGVTYHTQYSNALLLYDKASDMMKYNVLPSAVSYNLLKMNYLSVNIPLEFRYRHENGFKFSVGARIGLIAEVSQKYKGQDYTTATDTIMVKNLRMENKLKYNVDVYTRIGWKFVDVYYSFQATPLFEAGKGPKIYPMSVGISLSIF